VVCDHCTCVGHSVTICCKCGLDRRVRDAHTTLLAIGLQLEIIAKRIAERQQELERYPQMAPASQQRLRRLIAKDRATIRTLELRAGIR
jgi:hypothetical protein